MSPKTKRSARWFTGWLMAGGMLLATATAQAKIDLVTLPSRDKTQLSIYKSEDLTLVRETRTLTFNQGKNEIQFSWANTLIDPTSLQIRMVKNSPDFRVLDASYPSNSQNTIVWNIDAKTEGQAQVEITYFASGLNWRADYTAIANNDESHLRLEPNFTIFNNSGEEFENAQTRLVVGEINLVEAIAELARRGIISGEKAQEFRQRAAKTVMAKREMMDMAAPSAFGAMMEMDEAKEIIKAAVSEYYLYTIEGTENIANGWGKQLPNPRVDEIPIDVSYEYNPRKYGDQVIKFYKFKNDTEHELGDVPMPEGAYYVYSDDGRDGLRFQASYTHKYIPVGEDIELQLGSDGRVLFEPREMSMKRTNFEYDTYGNVIGYDIVREMELEIRNSNARTIPIKITWPLTREDWEITKTTLEYKKVDRETVEWKLDVPALDKKVIAYTLVTRTGSRDRVNK